MQVTIKLIQYSKRVALTVKDNEIIEQVIDGFTLDHTKIFEKNGLHPDLRVRSNSYILYKLKRKCYIV